MKLYCSISVLPIILLARSF